MSIRQPFTWRRQLNKPRKGRAYEICLRQWMTNSKAWNTVFQNSTPAGANTGTRRIKRGKPVTVSFTQTGSDQIWNNWQLVPAWIIVEPLCNISVDLIMQPCCRGSHKFQNSTDNLGVFLNILWSPFKYCNSESQMTPLIITEGLLFRVVAHLEGRWWNEDYSRVKPESRRDTWSCGSFGL